MNSTLSFVFESFSSYTIPAIALISLDNLSLVDSLVAKGGTIGIVGLLLYVIHRQNMIMATLYDRINLLLDRIQDDKKN